ncbi:iron-sulfur cluster assembly accessory protein [Gammaproteobacteria bacterium]|nr:iron-sulfur cluster assembly accessory protein [Gammaproteobacteria bacterium]
MNSIITFTDAAFLHLNEMLLKQKNSIGFRLSIKKTGCSGYAYVPAIIDKKIDGDINFTVKNQLEVFVDLKSESFLKGLKIDYIDDNTSGLKQKRLIFINPNEKNRCGCGESFTVE